MNTESLPGREISPQAHREWARLIEQDQQSKLEGRFSAWLNLIAEYESLFSRFVYENPDVSDLDLRQHRQGLHHMLATGEGLAVQFLSSEAAEGAAEYVALIDKKLKEITGVLHDWYTPPDQQSDLPESIVQGMRELAEGKAAPMDPATLSQR